MLVFPPALHISDVNIDYCKNVMVADVLSQTWLGLQQLLVNFGLKNLHDLTVLSAKPNADVFLHQNHGVAEYAKLVLVYLLEISKLAN